MWSRSLPAHSHALTPHSPHYALHDREQRGSAEQVPVSDGALSPVADLISMQFEDCHVVRAKTAPVSAKYSFVVIGESFGYNWPRGMEDR